MDRKTHYTTNEEITQLREELAEARTDEYKVRQRNARTKRIVLTVMYVFVITVLLGILSQLIYAKRTGEAPSLFGVFMYRIETASMDPTLPVGSVIVSKEPSNPEALSVGTVVTFISTDGERITHRIVQVIPAGGENTTVTYRTQGDNPQNSIDVEILTPDRIEAVLLFKVPLF
ncbi:MAG TPA: signal peptidase I [Bacillota bacterium]|nr:signal peptidase I [Bacillota bacterium]